MSLPDPRPDVELEVEAVEEEGHIMACWAALGAARLRTRPNLFESCCV